MIAAASANPLWFTARGAGTVSLLLLAAVTVLGVLSAVGWRSRLWPRFVSATLHRNLSLLAIALLVVHIVTAVLDPFSNLRWRDALVPVGAGFRPVWVGMGVLAVQVMVAAALTSLLRRRLGHRTWRVLHWLAYACWPLAVMHGLGTGTDARAVWSVMLTTLCVAAVVAAVAWRLAVASPRFAPLRAFVAGAGAMGVLVLGVWAQNGPLQPDWADRAGTPTQPTAAQPAAAKVYRDDLDGTMASRDGVTVVALRDRRDPSLLVVIRSAASAGVAPTVQLALGGRTLCTSPATVSTALDAACGKGRVHLEVSGGPHFVSGRLVAWGGALP